MSRVFGVVTGTVKDVKDPDSQGRVLIAFPWLPGDKDSYWAPVATLMTGGGRGSWFMPEVDDEVLVAFEHGNVDQPFVIGYLWNGVQKPPSDDGPSVRRIKTVSGHRLEFHDKDGAHKILLISNGGQRVQLDDNSNTITIETSGGEQVQLSPGQLEANAAAGKVVIDSSGVTVTHSGSVSVICDSASVTAATGANVTAGTDVSVTAGTTASVTAGAALTLTAPVISVNAPVTTFAGVLIAQTVVSSAVVGAAYTPAPGNTFGL